MFIWLPYSIHTKYIKYCKLDDFEGKKGYRTQSHTIHFMCVHKIYKQHSDNENIFYELAEKKKRRNTHQN